jgi:hypothetical protein
LIQDKNHALVFSAADPVADMASGILTLLKSVDGSGSGLVAEGLQSIQITDLNFDPSLLGLAIRETRAYSTNFGPANQPNNSVVDYFNIFLTKMDATSYILSMDGMDLNTNPTGGHFTRWYTGGAWGVWRWFVDEYDFVVDSNLALDQLIAYTGGLYKRVLIKSGTWTATSLSATAGVLWNLDSSGTTYVFGEKGSSIVFSGAFAGTIYGMYHAVIPADVMAETFLGVSVSITNTTATRNAGAFLRLRNLRDCKGTGTGNTTGFGEGFESCVGLDNCNGVGVGGTNGGGQGFASCTNLVKCLGTATGTGAAGFGYGFVTCVGVVDCSVLVNTTAAIARGFYQGNQYFGCVITNNQVNSTGNNCIGFDAAMYVSNCRASIDSAAGNAMAFANCQQLSGCDGTGRALGAGFGHGFNTCLQVIGCTGTGLAVGAGVGYGFLACQSMQQNRAGSASKTATYNTSFADIATNATAATAAGGYNLP